MTQSPIKKGYNALHDRPLGLDRGPGTVGDGVDRLAHKGKHPGEPLREQDQAAH